MHAEGLTSIQPLDQTIFTQNLESELYSSTNKSPHSPLKVTLKAQKVNRFYSIYSEQKNNSRNSSTEKNENISVSSLSLTVFPLIYILIYFLIYDEKLMGFSPLGHPNLFYTCISLFSLLKKYFSKEAYTFFFFWFFYQNTIIK